MSEQTREIVPIAMPGTHTNFLKYFRQNQISKEKEILDLGAGHGAMTKKLHESGYQISACDLFPEHFYFDEIECAKVDITKPFPYPDERFDVVIAVEVSEHIIDHELFFSELSRILRPDGVVFISTPNILSMKSRMHFLLRGFFFSFGPLEMNNYDGLQHVASLTLDQYHYAAIKNGLKPVDYAIDRKQKSSRWILLFLYPLMWLTTKTKGLSLKHNQYDLMVGRLLFLKFQNDRS